MKGKFMIIAALLGALTFGACVDTEESSSVTAIRNAKAEQLKSIATLNNAKAQAEATLAAAEAQLAAAQAQLLAAEAGALNATTEAQKIANQIAAAQAAQQIAEIEASMAIAAIQYEQALLNAQLAAAEAMQGLADTEKRILSAAYTKYFAALTDLSTAQKALADQQKTVASAEAALAKIDTIEEAIDDATKAYNTAASDVTKKQNTVDGYKTQIAKLEAAGGYSHAQVLKEIASAETNYKVAKAATWEAVGAKNIADKALAEFDTNEAEEAYAFYLELIPYLTLGGTKIDVNDALENEIGTSKDSWAFYLTELNNNGVYTTGSDKETAVVLFDTEISVDVLDEDEQPIYQQRVLHYGIHADAIATYEAELAKLLSTSTPAQDLAKATAAYEAYMETQDAEAVADIYNTYLENKAEVDAQIVEINGQIKALTYQLNIYNNSSVNIDKYYDEQIKDLQDEIKDLEDEIKDLEDEKDELKADAMADLKEYGVTNSTKLNGIIDDVEDLVDAIEAAQESYNDLAEDYAYEVAALNYMASLADAWIATYVTEYNAAVVAAYEAAQDLAAKQKAEADIYAEWESLKKIKTYLEAAGTDSNTTYLSATLNDLYAKLAAAQTALSEAEKTKKTAADTLAGLQNADAEKAAKALESYIAAKVTAIETEKAKLPALEAAVVMAESYAEDCKAALDAALAE